MEKRVAASAGATAAAAAKAKLAAQITQAKQAHVSAKATGNNAERKKSAALFRSLKAQHQVAEDEESDAAKLAAKKTAAESIAQRKLGERLAAAEAVVLHLRVELESEEAHARAAVQRELVAVRSSVSAQRRCDSAEKEVADVALAMEVGEEKLRDELAVLLERTEAAERFVPLFGIYIFVFWSQLMNMLSFKIFNFHCILHIPSTQCGGNRDGATRGRAQRGARRFTHRSGRAACVACRSRSRAHPSRGTCGRSGGTL
jgi:hypothetical protein